MKKTLLSIDYRLQLILLLFIGGTFFMVFPLMLLVPLGIYQVMSAAVKGFQLDSYKHRVFALVAASYGTAIMFIAFNDHIEPIRTILDMVSSEWRVSIAIFFYIIIPVISAIYYVNQSYRDYLDAVEEELALSKVKEFV